MFFLNNEFSAPYSTYIIISGCIVQSSSLTSTSVYCIGRLPLSILELTFARSARVKVVRTLPFGTTIGVLSISSSSSLIFGSDSLGSSLSSSRSSAKRFRSSVDSCSTVSSSSKCDSPSTNEANLNEMIKR